MLKGNKVIAQDYGTNCKDCDRYQKLGDICMIEHGKKFQWEYCRDFESKVVLPDYKELMRSVRADHALQRKKEKEKKDKEKRRKLKEKAEREELRKKKRSSMLRKRRERLKKKLLRDKLKLERAKATQQDPPSREKIAAGKKFYQKKQPGLRLENAQNSVVGESHGVTAKSPDVSDDER